MNLMKLGLIIDIILVITVFLLLGVLYQKNYNFDLKLQENVQRIEKLEKIVDSFSL
jgi:hypothetical protein